MNADYMDFMSVASSVKEKTVTALKVVEDLAGFAKELGVEWGGEGGTGGGGDRVSKLLDMDMVCVFFFAFAFTFISQFIDQHSHTHTNK